LSLPVALGEVSPTPERLEGIQAFSRPSEDVTLAFVRPGLVAKVHIEEGQHVKAGKVLIQLDDEAEQAQLEQYKAEAEDDTRIEAAIAEQQQKEVDLKRTEKAHRAGAASDLEVDHAKLDVLIAKLSLQLARFQQAQNKRKYTEAKILVERMKMVCPFDGQVAQLGISEGQAVKALEDRVIRIVKIDPLEIDVHVPLALARARLRNGQPARVLFAEADGSAQIVEGKIINIDPVSDTASDTLGVKIEVPNPTHRPAGEWVIVRFPPPERFGAERSSKQLVQQETNNEE